MALDYSNNVLAIMGCYALKMLQPGVLVACHWRVCLRSPS